MPCMVYIHNMYKSTWASEYLICYNWKCTMAYSYHPGILHVLVQSTNRLKCPASSYTCVLCTSILRLYIHNVTLLMREDVIKQSTRNVPCITKGTTLKTRLLVCWHCHNTVFRNYIKFDNNLKCYVMSFSWCTLKQYSYFLLL